MRFSIFGMKAYKCRPAKNKMLFFIFLFRFHFSFIRFRFIFEKTGLSVFSWGGESHPRTRPERSSLAFDRGGPTGLPQCFSFGACGCPQHLIEAAKPGRLDQSFCSGAIDDPQHDTTRQAFHDCPMTVRQPFPGTHKHRHTFQTF